MYSNDMPYIDIVHQASGLYSLKLYHILSKINTFFNLWELFSLISPCLHASEYTYDGIDRRLTIPPNGCTVAISLVIM